MFSSPTIITPLEDPLSSSVSKYTINNYVTYDVEINMSLVQTAGTNVNYFFKYARLNDRQPNNPLTRDTPEYQRSTLLYSSITGYNVGELLENHTDKFNNTYDSFNATFTGSGSVKLSQKYRVTINEIAFGSISSGDIGAYDMSDPIFDLYCNNSEPFYNITDPDLISLSNSLSSGLTNPVDKANVIFNWVYNNIEYTLVGEEMGASWAYANLAGDCSEYSSLMVTLLRIQGIPARKVTGHCVSVQVPFYPRVGDIYNFDLYTDNSLSGFTGSNTPYGHAWMEYYVPNIGWIACDPTWGPGYFNRMDYQRLTHNIGAYFFYPPSQNYSEFSNPTLYFTYTAAPTYTFNYDVKLTVVDTDVVAPTAEEEPPIIPGANLIVISLILSAGITGLVWKMKRRTTK